MSMRNMMRDKFSPIAQAKGWAKDMFQVMPAIRPIDLLNSEDGEWQREAMQKFNDLCRMDVKNFAVQGAMVQHVMQGVGAGLHVDWDKAHTAMRELQGSLCTTAARVSSGSSKAHEMASYLTNWLRKFGAVISTGRQLREGLAWDQANRRESAKEFQWIMDRFSLELIGAGNFSVVLGDKDFAYKWSFGDDDAGKQFARMVARCAHKISDEMSKHLPEIEEIVWCTDDGPVDARIADGHVSPDTPMLVVMERLSPWSYGWSNGLHEMGTLLNHAWDIDAFRQVADSHGHGLAILLQRLGTWADNISDKCSRNCREDLHDENLMLRADGTVVITDPLAYYNGKENADCYTF